jgi:hypothetical protein
VKKVISIAMVLMIALFASVANAKFSTKVINAIRSTYPAAMPQKGLESAFEKIDPSKMRGYVVIEKGGIAAEQARHFISWQEYDYRGVTVHMNDDGRITTRRGKPYAYLQRGDVMAVAGIKFFHNTVYLRLLSADVYIPENRRKEKRHSKVTVMLGFKFSKKELESGDAKKMLAAIEVWAKPFMNEADAKSYAVGIKAEGASEAAAVTGGVAGASAKGSRDERMQSLEDKINAAKKQMDEAEAEMKALKKDAKK